MISDFVRNLTAEVTYVWNRLTVGRSRYSQQLITGSLVSALLTLGLLGGGWFGWRSHHERQRRVVAAEQQELRAKHAQIKLMKAAVLASPPMHPDNIARLQTRRLVRPDRSNVDCGIMKCAALTFDDGPSAYTNEVVGALKSRQAVGTFFMLGIEVVKRPEAVHRVLAAQSEVGNHTWNHAKLVQLPDPEIVSQLDQTDKAILAAGGKVPRLVRPPYGQQDGRVASVVGRPLVLWSIDAEDWHYRDPEIVYQHIISHIHPGGIAIMHDIYPSSVVAVPRIVDELQRQGYVLVTVSELFGMNDQNIGQFTGQTFKRR